jgi:hypothetical protein
MSSDLAFERRIFLRELDIGDSSAMPLAADHVAQPVFTASQQQAIIVGSEVVSFTAEVEAEFRQAIADSALVAQLGANAKVDPKLDPVAWFDSYFAILGVLGWATQVRDTAEYRVKKKGMQVHEAITEVVTAFLGPLPGAATLVKLALDSLKSMEKDTPWITLFNRETERANVGRFQFTLIRRGPDNNLLADALCFALEADREITQILFFKLSKVSTRMRRSLGTVSIGADALAGLRPLLKAKIEAQRAAFLLDLPLKVSA